jgi:hypothetical protein
MGEDRHQHKCISSMWEHFRQHLVDKTRTSNFWHPKYCYFPPRRAEVMGLHNDLSNPIQQQAMVSLPVWALMITSYKGLHNPGVPAQVYVSIPDIAVVWLHEPGFSELCISFCRSSHTHPDLQVPLCGNGRGYMSMFLCEKCTRFLRVSRQCLVLQIAYVWRPFTNEARTDHLQLQHWVKVNLDATGKIKEKEEEPYYFAKYNVKVRAFLRGDVLLLSQTYMVMSMCVDFSGCSMCFRSTVFAMFVGVGDTPSPWTGNM